MENKVVIIKYTEAEEREIIRKYEEMKKNIL